MNLLDYLEHYNTKTFKEVPFNEVDALAFSLMSYFPFDLLQSKDIDSKDVAKFLKTYRPIRLPKRKRMDIIVLNVLCSSKRYKGIKFLDFIKKKNGKSIEQFQAVTIALDDFLFVSFCGTDASIVGWREDFNMSFLEMVPSEVDAIKYINDVRKKHPFKPLYIGGHSKGGRLAVRAGKEIYKNNTLKAVFSFDGPNFTDSFYDYQYDEMKHLIYEYAPNESIIGRLVKDTPKIIVESSATLLSQHDTYTWLVEDDHFVHALVYTETSNRIAKVTSKTVQSLDNQSKNVVVNTLFDVANELKNKKITPSDKPIETVKYALSNVKMEWKNIPRSKRRVVMIVLFKIIWIIIKTRKTK